MSLRSRILAAALTLSSLPLAGCGPPEAEVQAGEDALAEVEAALCSASDVGGLKDGSVEAAGVLRAANTVSEAALRSAAGLSALAAKNIVKARAGADQTPGTSDDVPFATLRQLSAVCQVGNATITRLLTYAKQQGWVGAELPFVPCAGDLSPLELQGLFGKPAWLSLKLERYTRGCNENQGVKTCQAWARGTLDNAPSAYAPRLAENNRFLATIEAVNGLAALSVKHEAGSGYWASTSPGLTAAGSTALELTLRYRGYTDVCDDYSYGGGWGSGGCLRSHYDYWDADWRKFTGTVSESCLKVADPVERSSEVAFGPGVASYTESVRTLTSAP